MRVMIKGEMLLKAFTKKEHSFNVAEDSKKSISIKLNQRCFFKEVPLLLIIKDPKGNVRLQYQTPMHQELVISEDGELCSVGATKGAILKGDWLIQIAYIPYSVGALDTIKEEMLTYEIEINLDYRGAEGLLRKHYIKDNRVADVGFYNQKVNEDKRWYKGDFHTHTTLSDGNMDDRLAMEVCEKQDLDFLYITEHNILTPSFYGGNTLIIPSMELTTPLGHYNVFAMKAYYDIMAVIERLEGTDEDFDTISINKMLQDLKDQDYLISVNHPFMVPWANQYDIDLGLISHMEIMCDPTFEDSHPSTLLALEFFDKLWLEGHKIWGIGGSDSHLLPTERFEGAIEPSIYGDPGTYVFCEGLSVENLKEALQKGSVYFSRYSDVAVHIHSGGENILPGSEVVNDNKSINYCLKSKEPWHWRLIIDGKAASEKDGSEVSFTFSLERGSYARVEAWKGDSLVAFINPIYKEISRGKKNKWKEVLGRVTDDKRNNI